MARRLIAGGIVAVLVAVLVGGALTRQSSAAGSFPTSGTGPKVVVGAPTLVNPTTVQFTVSTVAGPNPADPMTGWNLGLRWDPAVFTFSSATSQPAPSVTGFAAPPLTMTGGVTLGATAFASYTTLGLMTTVKLTVVAPGCSAIHIFTYGPPDNGDGSTGSFTIASDFASSQANQGYVDGTADNLGNTCVPAPVATPTPAASATSTPTPTNTPSPTPTNTPVSSAPDVTVSALSLAPSVDSGTMVAYSTTVTNNGSVTATGVTLDMTLPVGAVPFKNTYCKTYVPGHFSCKLPDLAAHTSIGVIFNVQVPIKTNNLVSTVLFTVAAANEPPANAGNNTAQVTTYVRGCPDLNGDNVINILDLTVAAQSYGLHLGQPGYNPLADQNGDNVITIADISLMASRYGATCKGLDTDQDGLSNYDEVNVYHTDPNNPDTDADGLPDGIEVLTYGSNPLVADTSGDGYTDGQKAALGTDPTNYCPIMRADVNMDHVVNILDFSTAGSSYRLSTGDPGYNPRVDQNADGTINILDFAIMAGSYQKSVLQCP